MSQSEIEFLKKLKNLMWSVGGLVLFSVIIATVPFYFKTGKELEYQKEQLNELKITKADRAIYEYSVTDIQKDISEINKKIDNIIDKSSRQ